MRAVRIAHGSLLRKVYVEPSSISSAASSHSHFCAQLDARATNRSLSFVAFRITALYYMYLGRIRHWHILLFYRTRSTFFLTVIPNPDIDIS
jgi:hypothetical protein